MDNSAMKFLKVIQYIQERGPVKQAEIAQGLGLSLMTINKVVNKLHGNGVIVKSGKASVKSGRRSGLFKLNNDLYSSVGIEINEDRILFAVVHTDGSVISTKKYPLDVEGARVKSSEDVLAIIDQNISLFLREVSTGKTKVASVGVAPEGIIDTENGSCVLGTHLWGIRDLRLRESLQETLGVPVFVDDPARAVAYYEKKFGEAMNAENFIYLYLGRGIGSGIVIDGKVYRGFRGIAGEIGHVSVEENGSRCRCGNYGCLETVASVDSIIRRVKEGIRDGVFTKIVDYCDGETENIDLAVLGKAADAKDKFAYNIIDHVGTHLGKAVALLINIFNPELVLIGGEVSSLGSHLLNSVKRVIRNDTLNIMNEMTEIRLSDYNIYMDTIGIAVEAFDSIFTSSTQKARNFVLDLLKKATM
jgi:N-acetylglucosamine repressor